MNLWKRGYLQRNIERKDCGQAEWVTGMFFLLILSILLHTQLQIASWQTTGMYLEDALAASNLASALIDLGEYGRTNLILVEDPEEAYRIYLEAVKENLQLDEQWLCENKTLISGQVEIVDYVVYNVKKGNVYASRVGTGGYVTESWSGGVGTVRAPDGNVIEHTGIYSEIRFPVRGFLGIEIPAHKGKLVDIVGKEEEN